MHVCTLHLIADVCLLCAGGDSKTVIGELYGPDTRIGAETSPEEIDLAGLLVADDIGVNGVAHALAGIVHKHSVRIGKRLDVRDILPGERARRLVGHSHSAGTLGRIVPMSFGIIQHIAAVNVLHVRSPDPGPGNPLRSLHSAECIAHKLPVDHISGAIYRKIYHVFGIAGSVLGGICVEISGPLPVIED